MLPFLLMLCASASEPESPQSDTEPPELDASATETLTPLSKSQHKWLRPSRHRLPANPYGNTDYTAYTLEFGEVKIGLASMTVGALPRTQIGTVPALNALGIYNGHAKVNIVRLAGFDLAVRGAAHWLPLGDFDGNYFDAGVLVSQQFHPRFSVHAGASYTSMSGRGVPDLTQASPLITAITGDLSGYNPPKEWFGDEAPRIRGEAVSARVAFDYRFNRRDSVVIQGQALLRAAVITELGDIQITEALPPIAGLDEALSYTGNVNPADAYVASIAYQASWKQVDLRVGVGLSSVPYAWALQSTELSYRFGGETRREEHRQRKTWRFNRRDVSDEVASTDPPDAE
ncbi:MAG: hypothetical protein AB8H79_00120 [Myxococcota bacterium]